MPKVAAGLQAVPRVPATTLNDGEMVMGKVVQFPPARQQTKARVLPYGGWLTDARLASLGFSKANIRAVRAGEPIGRVLARRARRNSAKATGSQRAAQVS